MIQPEIRQLLQEGQPGQPATVRGWVRTARGNKNVMFVAVNDGSTIHNLQVVAKPDEVDEETRKAVTTGASVEAVGILSESQGSGQRIELQATAIRVIGGADANTYPLQKKGHSLEFLREIAHLRPRTNTFGAVFRLRHAMSFAIHEFFNERGFFNVHTPIITGSDAEGAGAMFRVTTLDAAAPPMLDGAVDFSQDFFGRSTNLTVSGQLEGELAALALGKIYTFGPTFRAENSNTTRHLAEFWMIEPEMAFYDLNDNQDLAEAFLKHLVSKALERCPDDIAKLAELYDKTLVERLQSVIAEPFVRITYTEAVAILEKVTDVKFEFPVSWGTDLQSEHERYLVEKHFGKPVILTNYPKEIKSFYMRLNDDGKTVAAMDVLFPGIGEIIGGSQREERADVLEQRMDEMHIPKQEMWWFMDTRRYGTVPHAGFGLGFERLMLFVTGMGNIRDVIPFPRFPGSAEF